MTNSTPFRASTRRQPHPDSHSRSRARHCRANSWAAPRRPARLWGVLLLGIFAAGIVLPAAPVVADDDGRQAGTTWALLIGVEKYHRAVPLRYTINDVKQLAATLRRHGNLKREQILELTDQAASPRSQPLKASLLSEIPVFLKKPAAQDQILVYFSGHGFKGQDGKLYLAPVDCDPANAEATGIATSWLRQQLAKSPAQFKLLILDACHAGSEKSVGDDTVVRAEELLASFEGLDKVVTLASCSADEKSQIWEDKQQSLFSFWLNQGLKGHADKDGDDVVDLDELYNFVYRNVAHTSQTRFPRKQTPRRSVHSGVEGTPVVLRVYPQNVKLVLDDLAEQLALDLEERQIDKIGVLEFANETPTGEVLGAEFGSLGKWCAEELERRLMDYGAKKFAVLDQRRLQAALAEQQFSLDNLGSTAALKELARKTGGLPALVQGKLSRRVHSALHLQCKVVATDSDQVYGLAAGPAVLNESQWAMLGRSAVLKPDDYRPPLPDPHAPPNAATDQLVQRLDQQTQGPHPLQDPAFRAKFNVYVKVGGQERRGVFRGNDYLVPLRKGEEYSVRLENKSGQLVHVRLFVDGLNTLPEKSQGTKGVETWEVAPRVSLDVARAWILDPARDSGFTVSGFTTETGAQGKWKRFLVTDAEKSLAARRKFTEQLGLITAAFYADGSGTRSGIGTTGGREEKLDLTERGGLKVGNLLHVVQIRYVDADGLPKAGN